MTTTGGGCHFYNKRHYSIQLDCIVIDILSSVVFTYNKLTVQHMSHDRLFIQVQGQHVTIKRKIINKSDKGQVTIKSINIYQTFIVQSVQCNIIFVKKCEPNNSSLHLQFFSLWEAAGKFNKSMNVLQIGTTQKTTQH